MKELHNTNHYTRSQYHLQMPRALPHKNTPLTKKITDCCLCLLLLLISFGLLLLYPPFFQWSLETLLPCYHTTMQVNTKNIRRHSKPSSIKTRHYKKKKSYDYRDRGNHHLYTQFSDSVKSPCLLENIVEEDETENHEEDTTSMYTYQTHPSSITQTSDHSKKICTLEKIKNIILCILLILVSLGLLLIYPPFFKWTIQTLLPCYYQQLHTFQRPHTYVRKISSKGKLYISKIREGFPNPRNTHNTPPKQFASSDKDLLSLLGNDENLTITDNQDLDSEEYQQTLNYRPPVVLASLFESNLDTTIDFENAVATLNSFQALTQFINLLTTYFPHIQPIPSEITTYTNIDMLLDSITCYFHHSNLTEENSFFSRYLLCRHSSCGFIQSEANSFNDHDLLAIPFYIDSTQSKNWNLLIINKSMKSCLICSNSLEQSSILKNLERKLSKRLPNKTWALSFNLCPLKPDTLSEPETSAWVCHILTNWIFKSTLDTDRSQEEWEAYQQLSQKIAGCLS